MGRGSQDHRQNAYNSIEGSLPDGSNNLPISLTNVKIIWNLEIINDNVLGSGHDMTVRFNAVDEEAITVKANESFAISGYQADQIFISNASGTAINYRIRAFGE